MNTKDSKHWASTSEAAGDELKDALAAGFDWALRKRKELAVGAGAAAAALLLLGLFLYSKRARESAAWDKLSQAELLAYSGRPQEAQTLLGELAESGAGPAVTGLARIMEGDLLYPRGEYDKAAAAYERAYEQAPEALKPFALADKVSALEAAGKHAECAAAAASFLELRPEHLLAASVHASLARCQQASGQTAAAQATLDKLALQYPGTLWAEWAASRRQKPTK